MRKATVRVLNGHKWHSFCRRNRSCFQAPSLVIFCLRIGYNVSLIVTLLIIRPMPFFFSTWLFQPLFLPSILSDAYRWGRAGPAIGSPRKLFGKDGLWTQPTLFVRGELPRMVQPMQRLRCQNAERV